MLISLVTISNSECVCRWYWKFASKLFNHYGYYVKITNSLKSFFAFGKNGIKSSTVNTINNPKTTPKKQKVIYKNQIKKKIVYNFKNWQSIQINP